MSFFPTNPPADPKALPKWLAQELQRLAGTIRDDAETVLYLTPHTDQGSLTAGVSADYKIIAGNVVRISSSVTVTLTGLVLAEPRARRELVLINVGTGVVVLKSEDSASSAPYRFALPTTWQLSANAAAVLWYDPASSRIRGISRT